MLEGSLGDFSLPDIFQLITLTKKTGALTVRAGDREGRVLFRGGEVCFAVADVHRVALGARLVASGLVDEEQVTRVLERKREAGGDVLSLLLDEAALDETAVDTFLRGQIEDAVFDLMRLESASFSFDATAEEADAVGLTVATEHLVMEGGRRMGEWSAIREQIPSSDAVLVLSPAPAAVDGSVSVNAEEWALLALVDGRRTVSDIVELTGRGEFTTSKLLAELVKRGFVQVSAADDEDGGVLAGMVVRREMLRRLEELELGEPVMRPESPPPSEPALEGAGAPAMPAAPSLPEDPVQPVTAPEGAEEEPDRAEAAREFAGLGLDDAVPAAPREQDVADGDSTALNGNHHAEANKQARPLTRDEDVNKGLLLRLIDGVKEA